MLNENKGVDTETIKREYNKKRRDGEKAFIKLKSSVIAPKHMMTGH